MHGASHWILYDFGQAYELGQLHLWNSNHPEHLDRGMREIAIDYSVDGETWISAGVFTLEMATGQSIYEGVDGPDLAGIQAQFLLLTGLSNWGGDCYGLSEIRVAAEQTTTNIEEPNYTGPTCFKVSTYPNPFETSSRVEIQSDCSEEIQYSLIDVFGKVLKAGTKPGAANILFDIGSPHLPSGNYFLQVRQGDAIGQYKLVKLERL